MQQLLSLLMSVLMLFLQFAANFIGGNIGDITIPTNPETPTTPVVSSDMRWPLSKSSYISEGYPTDSAGNYHGGIDIVLSSGDSEGEPFYAVKDGTVSIALNDGKNNSGFGNCVQVSHSSTLSTFYGQAKSISVKAGDAVKKGDLLGYIGKTGNAKTAHLHFEVWSGAGSSMERVDPLKYVKNPYDDTWTKPSDTEDMSGKFTFGVYGYGHGVGMSQDGAIKLANDGKKYDEILAYYYPGTSIKTDSATPKNVTKNGATVSLLEFLCKTVAQEIGESSPTEALKAQAVASYTYSKLYGYGSGQAYKASFSYTGTNVEKAVMAVLGMSKASDTPSAKYVEYNGKPAETYYFASAAGKTASSTSVWGGEEIPYLKGGITSPEPRQYSTKTYTAQEMYDLIQAYAKAEKVTINLGKDPSTWIKIVSHDASIDSKTGYVIKISVGGVEMSGNTFRAKVLKYGIKSHCFTVSYK